MGGYVPKHPPFLEYTFNLGTPERRAYVTVPEDITEEEAARLARIIQTLPMGETRADDASHPH